MFSLRPAPPIAALSGGPRQIGPFTAVAELGIGRRTTALVAFESGTPRALRVAHDGVDRTAFDTDLRAARAFDPSTALELTDVGDTLVAHGPLVVGESLATILEQTFASHRPADLGVALALASRAAAKLAAAGERRVHGDLVPHHVLVGYDGQVHLVDAVGGAYRERARAPGRAPYRSPEHVRGEPLTPASDVFVLGILLFELTTATPLFGGPSQRDPDGAIVQAKLPRPRELVAEGYPIELELILRKMLRPAAAGRFTDGAGVVEALRLYRGRRAEPTAEELGAWLASTFPARAARWRQIVDDEAPRARAVVVPPDRTDPRPSSLIRGLSIDPPSPPSGGRPSTERSGDGSALADRSPPRTERGDDALEALFDPAPRTLDGTGDPGEVGEPGDALGFDDDEGEILRRGREDVEALDDARAVDVERTDHAPRADGPTAASSDVDDGGPEALELDAAWSRATRPPRADTAISADLPRFDAPTEPGGDDDLELFDGELVSLDDAEPDAPAGRAPSRAATLVEAPTRVEPPSRPDAARAAAGEPTSAPYEPPTVEAPALRRPAEARRGVYFDRPNLVTEAPAWLGRPADARPDAKRTPATSTPGVRADVRIAVEREPTETAVVAEGARRSAAERSDTDPAGGAAAAPRRPTDVDVLPRAPSTEPPDTDPRAIARIPSIAPLGAGPGGATPTPIVDLELSDVGGAGAPLARSGDPRRSEALETLGPARPALRPDPIADLRLEPDATPLPDLAALARDLLDLDDAPAPTERAEIPLPASELHHHELLDTIDEADALEIDRALRSALGEDVDVDVDARSANDAQTVPRVSSFGAAEPTPPPRGGPATVVGPPRERSAEPAPRDAAVDPSRGARDRPPAALARDGARPTARERLDADAPSARPRAEQSRELRDVSQGAVAELHFPPSPAGTGDETPRPSLARADRADRVPQARVPTLVVRERIVPATASAFDAPPLHAPLPPELNAAPGDEGSGSMVIPIPDHELEQAGSRRRIVALAVAAVVVVGALVAGALAMLDRSSTAPIEPAARPEPAEPAPQAPAGPDPTAAATSTAAVTSTITSTTAIAIAATATTSTTAHAALAGAALRPNVDGDADAIDADAIDAGAIDAGAIDAGTIDAGAIDTSAIDAGRLDAGALDAGRLDAGALDAGRLDAGRLDAGAIDAGAIDAGRLDAGASDAATPRARESARVRGAAAPAKVATRPREAPRSTKTTRVLIRVRPKQASILVDGVPVDNESYIEVGTESRKVVVTAPGYADHVTRLRPGTTAPLQILLRKKVR